jgi:hypothetical protein
MLAMSLTIAPQSAGLTHCTVQLLSRLPFVFLDDNYSIISSLLFVISLNVPCVSTNMRSIVDEFPPIEQRHLAIYS